jgi:hypothetical protein
MSITPATWEAEIGGSQSGTSHRGKKKILLEKQLKTLPEKQTKSKKTEHVAQVGT